MQLETKKYRMVLRERYIHCKKWKQVAVDNDYDYSWIIKLHERALTEFKETFPNKFK